MSSAPRSLDRTPVLARRLEGLRSLLVREVLLHALGSVVVVACLWLAFAFVADRVLGVPRAVRWFHLLVLLALPGLALWREGLRHLRRLPDLAGLALLAERDAPDSEQLFVSAVQLQGRARSDSGEPLEDALVARVLERAERRAADFDPRRVLDPRGPRRRAALGGGAAALTVLWLALLPAGYASIFGARLFGATTPWPQRTFLALELPVTGNSATVVADGEVLRARVARGSDLPVLVRAEGVVPEAVRLELDDGREIELGGGRDGLFRTELPALREDLTFSVVGGDDVDRLPRAEIEVLQPPDVTSMAIRVTPPEYSGLPPELSIDRGVRALRGSTVEVFVRTTPGLTRAVAELLPEGGEVVLEPRPFPTAGTAPAADADTYGFDLVAEDDLRLRFRLTDANGLGNPDPGLFSIDVVEDRVPEVSVIAPGRSNVESVPGGALALRARVEDDFGLTGVRLEVAPTDDAERVLALELETSPLEPAGDVESGGRRLHRLLEIDALTSGLAELGAEDVGQLTLSLSALDNADPPQRGSAAPIRVRLLSLDELLRRVQDRLARARVEADELGELQREQRRRVEDLLLSLSDDGALEAADARAVQSALNGQRRVGADAEALLRELTATTELVLYARLDPKGEELLRTLDAELATSVERSFDSGPWRRLVASHERVDGDDGFASHLIEIVELGLAAFDAAGRGAEALADAEAAGGGADLGVELATAVEAQGETLARIEDLLDRLAEWDNFQSVLTLTRDILERQRALRDRLRRLASEK